VNGTAAPEAVSTTVRVVVAGKVAPVQAGVVQFNVVELTKLATALTVVAPLVQRQV
jgi:hypothetical protein